MWTDIREEVEKLEAKINSLETEQGDGNENKAD
jgi:BMFP domain-containing protein YqiC